jgi:hypothetical protein
VDERVARLKTPAECDAFIKNVHAAHPKLALEARLRAVQLRAAEHGAKTQAELEALEAVYAYEAALSRRNGKKTRASRTWDMIKRRGIIASVDAIVQRPTETVGYTTLVEMGLKDFAFENVVLRHCELFSVEAVERSRQRVEKGVDA